MAEKLKGVFDSGPLIHLSQVNGTKTLRIFREILVPDAVFLEVTRFDLPGKKEVLEAKNVVRKNLLGKTKDYAKLVAVKFGLELGECEAIALAKQENINGFFTDDLNAREAAKEVGLEAHGSMGIITRAFREGTITKDEAIEFVKKLHGESSLFITSDLVREIISQINSF